MARPTFLLDGMIYNLLGAEIQVRQQILALTRTNRIEIIASPVVVQELALSPFRGLPDWFPIAVVPEGIAISGLARSGMARSSTGQIYKAHLGQSKKSHDAVLAHSAHSIGATLVSDDHRCRERLKVLAGAASAFTYGEFKVWVGKQWTLLGEAQDMEG